ncbi:MAG: DUF4384 domain-containing protein [Bacteroidales bacterium]|nr:DUF4384 domain-containing protein [Bacteroidales bacterium]
MPLLVLSQKICGTYSYHAESNESIDEASKKAADFARIEALDSKFHSFVGQQTSSISVSEGEKKFSSFMHESGTSIKGEWLGDDKGYPQYDIKYENNRLVVTSTVCGEAREIKQAPVQIKIKFLKNGICSKNEAVGNLFKNEDEFYISFMSPVDGYLAIYLQDQDTVYCMLPYQNSKGLFSIQANKEYILFSKNAVSYEERSIVDEYILTTDTEFSQNIIYILFSTQKFTKANDNYRNGYPRMLSFKDFQRWKIKSMQYDNEMQERKDIIQILK